MQCKLWLSVAFSEGKSRQWNPAILLFAKLCILAVGLLCLEAGVPFANSYKGFVYLIIYMPSGLNSPKEVTF